MQFVSSLRLTKKTKVRNPHCILLTNICKAEITSLSVRLQAKRAQHSYGVRVRYDGGRLPDDVGAGLQPLGAHRGHGHLHLGGRQGGGPLRVGGPQGHGL